MAKEIVIDPRFSKPPNVVDVRDASNVDGISYYESIPDYNDFEEAEPQDQDAVGIPMPPTSFSVVSQTVRNVDGNQVVDVVLEVPDIPGVKQFDIRVAKAE